MNSLLSSNKTEATPAVFTVAVNTAVFKIAFTNKAAFASDNNKPQCQPKNIDCKKNYISISIASTN